MADIPSEMTWGRIRGNFGALNADSADAGLVPDLDPVQGTVTLTPRLALVKILSIPMIAVAKTVVCRIVDGKMIGPDGTNEVRVVASDSPGIEPYPLQWDVRINIVGATQQPAPMIIDVPSGGVVDLALIVPSPPAIPVVEVVTEETKLEAQAARDQAVAAAATAIGIEDVVVVARDEAVSARGTAVAAASTATQAKTAAETASSAAVAANTDAQAANTQVQQARVTTLSAAASAASDASRAEVARDAAEEAAEIATGGFSDAAVAGFVSSPTSETNSALTELILEVSPKTEDEIDPDDVGFDIIALIGQSNMVGRGIGIDTTNFDHEDPRVYAFGATGTLANTIVHATDSLAHWDPNGSVGPGLSIGKEYARTTPTNRKVLLVPCAQGGTAFTAGSKRWKVDHTPAHENLYELAIRQIKNALAAAGPNSRIVGFAWHQGEGGEAATYAVDFNNMLTGFRTRLGVPNAWCVLGEMNRAGNAISTNKQATTLVHIDTPRRETRTAFAYTGNDGGHNPLDTTHFSAQGERSLGRSMGKAIRLAQMNVPDSVPLPPPFITAVYGIPGTLRIRWDRPACRFTNFLVRYRKAGDTTWINWDHTPSLHYEAIISGLNQGDTYEMQAATVNENGTSDWSPIGTGKVSANLTPSVINPGPIRAYSLRKVRSEYTGNCIRLRRSSDGALAEIGFDANGNVDEAAMRAHCAGSDGFVRAWYDQTGNAGLSSVADNIQPKIVSAGVVMKENGRVVMEFDGVDDYFSSSTASDLVNSVNGNTTFAVLHDLGSANAPRIWSDGNASSDLPMYGLAYSATTYNMTSLHRVDAGGTINTADSPANYITPDNLQVVSFADQITSGIFTSDLRESDPNPRTRAAGTLTTNRFSIGAMQRTGVSNFFKGRMGEVLLWNRVLTAEERLTATNHIRDVYNMTYAV